jgi:hypothetical protein
MIAPMPLVPLILLYTSQGEAVIEPKKGVERWGGVVVGT